MANLDGCLVGNEHHANAFEDCRPYCNSLDATNYYMGPIHPRSKKLVGVRLAQGAAVSSYAQRGPVSGPTLSGCSVSGTKITVKFDAGLLGSGSIAVQKYFKGVPDPETGKLTGGSSKMQVLINASAFCMQTHADPIAGLASGGHHGAQDCWDDGAGHTLGPGNYDSGDVRSKSPPPHSPAPVRCQRRQGPADTHAGAVGLAELGHCRRGARRHAWHRRSRSGEGGWRPDLWFALRLARYLLRRQPAYLRAVPARIVPDDGSLRR
eukprot:COSAG01_NODE_6790_length_3496_cov_3.344127_5_plen_265_part_00